MKCPHCGSKIVEYQRAFIRRRKGVRAYIEVFQCYDCDRIFEVKSNLDTLPGFENPRSYQ